MTKSPITVEQLLATYWLDSESQIVSPENAVEILSRFCEKRGLATSELILEKAANQLNAEICKGDVGQWVVAICFFSHPHTLWNFMIDAVAAAENDDHLGHIAASLAEHILAYYGSMIPHFEKRAQDDNRFKRMLTGVWRHMISDRVWMRLRAIQADVPDPLPQMIPLEHGAEYKSDSLKQEHRENDDKGMFVRAADGEWVNSRDSESKSAGKTNNGTSKRRSSAKPANDRSDR